MTNWGRNRKTQLSCLKSGPTLRGNLHSRAPSELRLELSLKSHLCLASSPSCSATHPASSVSPWSTPLINHMQMHYHLMVSFWGACPKTPSLIYHLPAFPPCPKTIFPWRNILSPSCPESVSLMEVCLMDINMVNGNFTVQSYLLYQQVSRQ